MNRFAWKSGGEGYIDVTKGSRAILGYLVGYIDVTEGSRAMLGYLVGYMDVTERSRAILGYPVCCMVSWRGLEPC
jgi:hypothetical protein